MSALHALHGDEVEADAAFTAVGQLVQWRIRGGLGGGAANAQHMFAGILWIELELFDGPRLYPADAGTRREFVVDGSLEEIDCNGNLAAAAEMQTTSALYALHLLLAIGEFISLFVLINEQSSVAHFGDTVLGDGIENVADGALRGQFDLE